MDESQKILSDITVYMKYAKFVPELKRRETWEELVTRNMNMHIKKYPKLESEIREVYKYVYAKKVLPSMRSMQFGGKPIEISPNRIYNCAYLPIDSLDVFEKRELIDELKYMVDVYSKNFTRNIILAGLSWLCSFLCYFGVQETWFIYYLILINVPLTIFLWLNIRNYTNYSGVAKHLEKRMREQ